MAIVDPLPPRHPEQVVDMDIPWLYWNVQRLELYFVLFWIVVTGIVGAAASFHYHDVAVIKTLDAQRDELRREVSTLKDRVVTDEFDISDMSMKQAQLKAQVDGLTDEVNTGPTLMK